MKTRVYKHLPWVSALLVLLVSLMASGALFSENPRPQPPPPSHVAPGGVVCFGYVDLRGGVSALSFVQAGRVSEVLVRENEAVKAGDVLARLDDSLALDQVREAEEALRSARTRLAQARKRPAQHEVRLAQQRTAIEAARHRLSVARRGLDQKQQFYGDGFLHARELDVAADQAREAEAAVRAEELKLEELELVDPSLEIAGAEAEAAAWEARVEQARRKVTEMKLVAPADGKALRVLVNPGELTGPGSDQPAVLFCPGEPLVVRAEVEQEYATRVRLGQEVLVEDDTRSPRQFRGTVVRLSDWYTRRRSVLQEPLEVNDVRTLECLIAVEGDAPDLRIGQRVRVTIGVQVP